MQQLHPRPEMITKQPSASAHNLAEVRPSAEKPRAAEWLLRKLTGKGAAGELSIRLPGAEPFTLASGRPGPVADIEFTHWRALLSLLASGDIGLANAYRAGHWQTSDLTRLLAWAMQNEAALAEATTGKAAFRALNRLSHGRRRNSRANSRRNIAAHYNLGNDFYAQWLDRGMNYSSAIYQSADQSLEDAQVHKVDRICDLLELNGGESVLEIGCGWGAVAERLTARHDCTLTGLTLSEPQQHFTQARLARAGRAAAADIRLQDYRDVEGTFDRIVSIEMLEAVGAEYWAGYFAKIHECLAPGGVAVLQAITIDAERYIAYRERPDFIQLQIFPGGALPTIDIIAEQAAAAGLELTATELFASSYADTLAEWRRRFNAAWTGIAALGFDDKFRRLWNYYLSYCEVGFRTNAVDVGLYQLKRRS